MAEHTVLLPKIEYVEAIESPVLRQDESLKWLESRGYEGVFMPFLVNARILSGKDHLVWQNWYTNRSAKGTGRWKGRGDVEEIYAHIATYFSNPDNIKAAIEGKMLVKGAGINTQEEFDKVRDRVDGENVFAVNHSVITKWPSGKYGIDKPTEEHLKQYKGKIDGQDMIAINHPQTLPFLGGKERAERYLERHKEVFGNVIRIGHYDDLYEQPLWRLLFLGDYCNDDLDGDYFLNYGGRFLGGKQSVAQKDGQLENLVGKAVDVGNGLLVVRAEQITPEVYELLTKRQ